MTEKGKFLLNSVRHTFAAIGIWTQHEKQHWFQSCADLKNQNYDLQIRFLTPRCNAFVAWNRSTHYPAKSLAKTHSIPLLPDRLLPVYLRTRQSWLISCGANRGWFPRNSKTLRSNKPPHRIEFLPSCFQTSSGTMSSFIVIPTHRRKSGKANPIISRRNDKIHTLYDSIYHKTTCCCCCKRIKQTLVL